jgi:hypothetical protein
MTTRSAVPVPRLAGLGVGVLLTLTTVTAATAAQQPLSPVEIRVARSASENARADSLEAKARAMYSTPRWYREAARLHRRAALIRGSDPRSVASFRSAAWLYSVAGSNGIARTMMEQAAERATAVGDVEGAANSYIDAAFLAIASSREDQLPVLLSRTRAVLSSPLLTEDRRRSILQRVGGSPQLARLDSADSARP